ncbi:tyrosine/nicotianamine aminotransferase, pyridoxal phosphate-dependent transferase [Tanacetum coccineum]
MEKVNCSEEDGNGVKGHKRNEVALAELATAESLFVAVSRIIENTPNSFFMNINKLLGEASDMLYKKLKEILHVDCPHKPEGSMFSMVKLNLSDFNDIVDDRDLCMKLAKEESVIVFPGKADGLKNWIRVSYSMEPKWLEEAIQRMKEFCYKHAKHSQ